VSGGADAKVDKNLSDNILYVSHRDLLQTNARSEFLATKLRKKRRSTFKAAVLNLHFIQKPGLLAAAALRGLDQVVLLKAFFKAVRVFEGKYVSFCSEGVKK
jgi:hypothetical protein